MYAWKNMDAKVIQPSHIMRAKTPEPLLSRTKKTQMHLSQLLACGYFKMIMVYLPLLHPWRLTWNIIMEVWKIMFLSKLVICRFHVNLPGCMEGALEEYCR